MSKMTKITPADGKLDLQKPVFPQQITEAAKRFEAEQKRQFLIDHRRCQAPDCLNDSRVVILLRGKPMAYCEGCAGEC